MSSPRSSSLSSAEFFSFPNDYAIFRASFWNLLAHRDLYVLRLDQAHDYFKYSPSFALLFARSPSFRSSLVSSCGTSSTGWRSFFRCDYSCQQIGGRLRRR